MNSANILSGGAEKKHVSPVFWLCAAVAVYVLFCVIPAPAGFNSAGMRVYGLIAAALVLWISNCLPFGVSSLILLFIQQPLGIANTNAAVASAINPTLFFIIASYFLGGAITASGLGKRISYKIAVLSGGSPKKALFLIMAAVAAISTVISDLPSIIAFIPVCMELITDNGCDPKKSNFAKSLFLGITVAALLGGAATPAGTAMNLLTMGQLEAQTGIRLSFWQWSRLGLPFVVICLPLFYLILTAVFKPELKTLTISDRVRSQAADMGSFTRKEISFLIIVPVMIALWLTESLHKIPSTVVAVLGTSLFFLPGIRILEWDSAKKTLPWEVIFLVCAANSLGAALMSSGGARFLAQTVFAGVASFPFALLLVFVIAVTILLHLAIPINPAIITILVPILISVSAQAGISPVLLVLPMGISISATVLLPFDPSTLITYNYRYYSVKDYIRLGSLLSVVWLTVLSVLILVLL